MTCARCQLPISESERDPRSPRCVNCRREHRREYERKYMPGWTRRKYTSRAVVKHPHRKRCSACGEVKKTRGTFTINRARLSGLDDWCRACKKLKNAQNYRKNRSYWRLYKQENRERYLEHARRWGSAHPDSRQRRRVRRARRLSQAKGSFTLREWKLKLALYPNCPSCGRDWSETLRPTVDHIVPICKGGGNDIDNVQPLCRPCNSRKGEMTMRYELKEAR